MLTCQLCFKKFKTITNTHLKKEHGITLKSYIDKFPNYPTVSEEVKKRRYKNHSKTMSRLRREGIVKSPPMSIENKQKQRDRMLRDNPMKKREIVKKMRATFKERFDRGDYDFSRSEEAIKRYSLSKMADKNPMKRPEVAMKNAKAHNRVKSGIERWFDTIIKAHKLPLKYVGNNKKWIGYKNPDYIHTDDNVKLVIEVTSDAYNRVEKGYEEERIKHFEKHGYKCITIRKTNCRAAHQEGLKKDFGILLTNLIKNANSYQTYHTNKGEITCIQF